jgi:hypothetical protein
MTLLNSCETYLLQAQRLLMRLEQVHYHMPHAHCFGSSIGGHIRHCLDHFELFFRGVAGGRVDYDARDRHTQVESNVEAAREKTETIINQLRTLAPSVDEDREIQVKLDCGGPTEYWKRSSVGRELQFLASHTVHHFAIIGIMCNALGIVLDADFGMAPSTLRYNQASA